MKQKIGGEGRTQKNHQTEGNIKNWISSQDWNHG